MKAFIWKLQKKLHLVRRPKNILQAYLGHYVLDWKPKIQCSHYHCIQMLVSLSHAQSDHTNLREITPIFRWFQKRKCCHNAVGYIYVSNKLFIKIQIWFIYLTTSTSFTNIWYHQKWRYITYSWPCTQAVLIAQDGLIERALDNRIFSKHVAQESTIPLRLIETRKGVERNQCIRTWYLNPQSQITIGCM